MNCFAHALPHLDDPYFAVGSCIPDWLVACDRKCRTREKHARKFFGHPDPIVAAIAKGVAQHHHDDSWFHQTPMFNKLILDFAIELRGLFGNERSMRPSLIGHILVELFLDAYLHSKNPGKMQTFYEQVSTVDGLKIQTALNLFSTRPTDRLVDAIEHFVREKYLFDYVTDAGIIFRINKVFTRIDLQLIGDEILDWMPGARQRVYENAQALLPQYAIEV